MKTENQYQEQPNTCIIVNPVFNTVFKRLMENERIAKFFLSTIIGRCTKIMDMKLTIKIILCFIFMLSSVSICAQDSLSSKKLCKDVKYAFSFIRKTHINPYAYTDKKTIDSTEQVILKKLKERTKWSLFDFNIMMNLNTPALFDGHTMICENYFRYPWVLQYDSATLFFPYNVKIENNMLYLIHNGQELKLQSINKHIAADVLKQMYQGFHADQSLSVKNKQISLYFPFYYILIYDEKSFFEVEVVNDNGEIINLSANGKPREEIETDITNKRINHQSPRYDYKKDYCLNFYPDNIALLTVNSFSYDLGEKYLNFLSESFKEITDRQCKYLFIDISRNLGGSDHNADLLLDYLFENDYKIFGSVAEKRLPKIFMKKLRELKATKHLNTLKNAYSKRSNNTKDVLFYTFHRRSENVLYPFTGQIFLIQSDYTVSAALTMSSAIRTSRRGVLIGEPTGQPANFYAELIPVELPYSKLLVTCSISHCIYSSGSSHDKWIEPDIYLDLDKTELNEQTLNNLIEQCKKEYPHFFKYPPNANERERE
jgi:hypothetical protein